MPERKPLSHSPLTLLIKLGLNDDLEVYLEAFEWTVGTTRWPKEQWGFFLGPYLSGNTLVALKTLEKQEAADYAQLKAVILDQYQVMPESYRQRLRAPVFPEEARPRAIVAWLKDSTT